MNSVRYTLLFISVIVFSWPVIVEATLTPMWVWLYPFVIWICIICIAFIMIERNSDDQG